MRRPTLRALAYSAAVFVGAVSHVGVSAFASLAAREARGTSHDVRTSTGLWNAYQRARYSVVQEALLTQEFRLAASPYFEQRFAAEAARLENALGTVEHAAPSDKKLADETRRTQAELAEAVGLLVNAVNVGNAQRADRIARKSLDPLFRSAIATVNRGAAAHRAESRTGLEAAENAEATLRRSAVAVVLLALLVSATAVMAIRLRRRLDEARRLELERLRNAAFTDSLTGVHNHRAFHEHLGAVLERAIPEKPIGLLMLDLDGLKHVNDRYGHQAGDDRIRLLSSAAGSVVAEPEQLYRLGGDEFALILPDCAGAGALATARRIDEAFKQAAPSGEVSFSGRIAVWEGGITKDELAR